MYFGTGCNGTFFGRIPQEHGVGLADFRMMLAEPNKATDKRKRTRY